MPITRTTYPERILIVLNPDGTMKGAHQEAIETIADGDDVLSVKQLSAAPLDAGALAAVLPDQGSLLSQVQTLTDDLAAMTTDRDAEKTAKETALSDKTAAETQRDAETAAKTSALDQIAALTTAKAEAATAAAEALSAVQADLTTARAATRSVEMERDAALTAKTALESQVAALEAQLNPIDVNGFAILSAVQVRLALLAAGITFAHVDAAIDALPAGVERDTARTYWEYSVELHREHPLIGQFAAALGLTDEQVDTMWRGASQ
jgi:hypothetical protein